MAGTTTTLKMPYPLGTDPISDGDDQIKALAERIEARMPWGNLGYAQIVAAGTSPVGTPVNIAGLSVTTPTLPAGRRLLITARGCGINTAASAVFTFALAEGGTAFQYAEHLTPAAVGGAAGMFISAVVMPSAGAHTYTAQVGVNTGGTFHAAANRPAYLLVEDIGPVSLA